MNAIAREGFSHFCNVQFGITENYGKGDLLPSGAEKGPIDSCRLAKFTLNKARSSTGACTLWKRASHLMETRDNYRGLWPLRLSIRRERRHEDKQRGPKPALESFSRVRWHETSLQLFQ